MCQPIKPTGSDQNTQDHAYKPHKWEQPWIDGHSEISEWETSGAEEQQKIKENNFGRHPGSVCEPPFFEDQGGNEP